MQFPPWSFFLLLKKIREQTNETNQIRKSDLNTIMLPAETITSKIYYIRKSKVMLDRDLAELYGLETAQLKRAVRRNIDRFP